MQQPTFNNLAFQLGPFQVQCGIDPDLTFSITLAGPQGQPQRSTLAVERMEMGHNKLHLEVSASSSHLKHTSTPTYLFKQD
jgi:hypothetical protein